MTSATYDTRFFVEHYYSDSAEVTDSTTKEIRRGKDKAISSIVVHEVYQLTLLKDGRQTARLRVGLMSKDFKLIHVDEQLAVTSAEIRQEYRIPMADSIIAATASSLRAVCVTDDPHIQKIREVKTRWIM
ncbi:type II toxin-antitoxin system VapC family toxin [Candidatus Bathyarchaeota archaeon]|nr:MAG: type II toxin-antitoxin system VapC family toxin [Candidatus Bathyarchaeota archaeon]